MDSANAVQDSSSLNQSNGGYGSQSSYRARCIIELKATVH